MLIDSDFKDYYDTIRTYGVDKTVVYKRKNKLIEERTDFSHVHETYSFKGGYINATAGLVGFCGKLYPFLKTSESYYGAKPSGKDRIFCDYESLDKYLTSMKVKADEKYYPSWKHGSQLKSKEGRKRYFNPEDFKEYEKVFEKHKVPVFWVNSRGIVLSPILRELGFVTVKDPPTAFQEIMQYISGVLGTGERPMVEIADKYKAAAKGHDSPYSFRKPPGSKRGKPRWR